MGWEEAGVGAAVSVVGGAAEATVEEGREEGWAEVVRAVEGRVEGWAAEAMAAEGKEVEMEEG